MTIRSCTLTDQTVSQIENKYSAILICLPALSQDAKVLASAELRQIQPDWDASLSLLGGRLGLRGKGGDSLSWDLKPGQRLQLIFFDHDSSSFERMTQLRDKIGDLLSHKPDQILVDCSALSSSQAVVGECIAVINSAGYNFKKYSATQDEKPLQSADLTVKSCSACTAEFLATELALAHASDFIKTLTMRCGNDLTPEIYRKEAYELARELQVDCTHYDYERLLAMGAGAFTAVAQASAKLDASIIELSYQFDAASSQHLALVGKGVTYDTGGTNLKPDTGMYGMEGDMGGSALALSVFRAAVMQRWPINLKCYLAVSDNLTGPAAYRPNDIVSSLSGKTIEVVHTDAEGRMLLADTLTLASRAKPQAIIDFATLTGTCVRALGEGFSGVFTNRSEWHQDLIDAGRRSGERVWPFPLEKDFGDKLKSKVADIQQCSLAGGPDHIIASYFLSQFVENDVPWVHVDLASAEKEGGLGASSQDVTGFGPRFVYEFLKIREFLA